MRNLAVLSDQLHAVCAASIAASSGSGSGSGSDGSPAALVSVAFDKGASLVYLLSCAGTIYCFSDEGLCLLAAHSASPAEEGEAPDLLWFELTFVAGTGSLVAVSRSGAICSLDGEQAAAAAREGRSLKAERVGVIEGGLAGAAWSPDQSRLLLVTPLSLLSMSCDWEPLQEVANAPLLQGSLAGVSWRGDGSGVAVVSTDQVGNTGTRE
ncbi:hypothetical protein B484DRAFT_65662 [Ochromonadaceae sp. CCMP2298]|nr:hypothetical protein B484DRAFT_65662 [Ochromonadaceae sp. CCMP2298]